MLLLLSFIFIINIPDAFSNKEGLFDPIVNKTVAFFKPVSAEIVSLDLQKAVISAGLNDGVLKGMRLQVFRRGEPFRHPVTREILGHVERLVGEVEVMEASGKSSSCWIIKGDLEPGDLVRISASKKRLLFYQDNTVDFYLGDAYYRRLKETGVFEMVDAPIERMQRDRLLGLAEKEMTEAIISLSAEGRGDTTKLRQAILRVDGTVVSEDTVEVPSVFIRELRSKAEFMPDISKEPVFSYDISYRADLISAGDFNGDGSIDFAISKGTEVNIFSYGADLTFMYSIKGRLTESIIWMDAYDIDRDGRDELFLSTISDNKAEVNSYVYRVDREGGSVMWKTEGFIRVIDGTILRQAYSRWEGYSGRISVVHYDGEFKRGDEFGPVGLNIYDFTEFNGSNGRSYYLMMDDENHLSLLDSEGITIWRNEEKMGGFLREFSRGFSAVTDSEAWYVKDRMVRKNMELLVVKRKPFLKEARGIGYKSSQLLVFWYNNLLMEQSVLIDNISGELLDYAVFGDKVAVLSKPLLSLKIENLPRGESPFVTRLSVYSVR